MQLKEVNDRIDVAIHYGIAYPRLHHKQHIVDHLYVPEIQDIGTVPKSRYALAGSAHGLHRRRAVKYSVLLRESGK
jgi:hypothetical protein